MALVFNFADQLLSLPAKAAETALKADAERLDLELLLLAALSPSLLDGYPDNLAEIARTLGCSERKLDASVHFWVDLGVFSEIDAAADVSEEKVSETAAEAVENGSKDASVAEVTADAGKKCARAVDSSSPSYSADQIADWLEDGEHPLRALVEECQSLAGKLFNPTEVGKLAALLDYLALDSEQILLIYSYCATIGKPSVHYVEKMAYNLYDEGIDTIEKTEQYFAEQQRRRSAEGQAKRLFGLGERRLTQKEKSTFEKWFCDWKLSDELLMLAYEATVEKTGSFKLAYMEKIAARWHDEGLLTPEAVFAEREKRRTDSSAAAASSKPGTKSGAGSFNTDEFIDAALRRSYNQLGQIKPVSDHNT